MILTIKNNNENVIKHSSMKYKHRERQWKNQINTVNNNIWTKNEWIS